MNKQLVEQQLEKAMLTARNPSDWTGTVMLGGILTIALTLYSMLPAWGDISFKDSAGGLNPNWTAKVIAAMVIIICTVMLVRMVMHSAENKDAVLASPELVASLPFIKTLVQEIPHA